MSFFNLFNKKSGIEGNKQPMISEPEKPTGPETNETKAVDEPIELKTATPSPEQEPPVETKQAELVLVEVKAEIPPPEQEPPAEEKQVEPKPDKLKMPPHFQRLICNEVADWMNTVSQEPEQCRFAFNYSLAGQSRIAVVKDSAQCPEHLWFIGDIHGDILAMDSIIKLIDETTPGATLVFLGDMIDRHPYSYECIIYLLDLVRKRPGKILWIAGNHDVSISHNGTKFISNCDPCEFVDFLNSKPELKGFGIAFCNLVKLLPRVLFLPDGLVCTHGGVPHEDIQGNLESENDLSSEKALIDFTWTRIHSRAPRKIVNRVTTGCELGYENVKAFCDKASGILQIPVKRVICGHQHPCIGKKGFELLKNPDVPVLVLNSSVFPEKEPGASDAWMTPYIARYRLDTLPEETPVTLSEDEINQMYRPQPEPKTDEAIPTGNESDK